MRLYFIFIQKHKIAALECLSVNKIVSFSSGFFFSLKTLGNVKIPLDVLKACGRMEAGLH
jgi:hypothetical protein